MSISIKFAPPSLIPMLLWLNEILAIDNSKDFLDGTFSNMNDLITGDITNVTLSLKNWGQDLVNLGKELDL